MKHQRPKNVSLDPQHFEPDEIARNAAEAPNKLKNFNPFKKEAYSILEPWERKAIFRNAFWVILIAAVALVCCCAVLIRSQNDVRDSWGTLLHIPEKTQAYYDEVTKNAVDVKTGTYVENIETIDMKNSDFTVTFLLWFRWDGQDDLDMYNHFRLYDGKIQSKELVSESKTGNTNYQLIRVAAKISKNFDSQRFPLESHILRIFVESEYTADLTKLTADTEDSSVNPSISINGFNLVKHAVGTYAYRYNSNHGDPVLEGKGADGALGAEMVTSLLINRSGWGLFLKCFVALYGTLVFVIIILYINTYHRIDPLGMIPSALFGAVANIMVGANLLPDVLDMGLLEFVNFYGVFCILAVMLSVISVNRIRSHFEDRYYAMVYGNVMYYTITAVIVIGNILLPLCAWQFTF
ncbi:MAG: hypothetical protein ACOYB8_04670 [Eubacteriaceae bacterium]|jgi:hypothetical protein